MTPAVPPVPVPLALPLQAGELGAYVGYLLQLLLTLVAMVLGLFIVFQAYRGARRNGSRRMAFLALGLALLTVVPFAISLLVTALGSVRPFDQRVYTLALPVLTRVVELCGLVSILHSLRLDS